MDTELNHQFKKVEEFLRDHDVVVEFKNKHKYETEEEFNIWLNK